MGAGASAKATKPAGSARSRRPSVLLPLVSSEPESESLPDQLFVEGAGSARANGKFVLRTDKDVFPLDCTAETKREAVADECDRGAWFVKENDAGCWMGYVHTSKSKENERKWMIFAAREILYVAANTGDELSPRQGRWEVGDVGAAPAPTVNVKPLPSAFRLRGWKEHNYRLNGEYLPLDDGSKVLNGRPIFKHTPVVGLLCHQEKLQMYWSHGAWRITDKDISEEPANHAKQQGCIAFVLSDSAHPTDMPPEVVWQQPGSGPSSSTHLHDEEERTYLTVRKFGDDFVGVSIEAGTSVRIFVSTSDGEDVISLIVRPWFDMVVDIEAQVFASDTPSQRQQLFLGSKRLQDDGSVLAQHGVIAEVTVHLVTLEKKELLDAFFKEPDAAGAFEYVGGLVPAQDAPCAFFGAIRVDGRIYLSPRNAPQAVYFDLDTKTYETFGDVFPESVLMESDKWGTGSLSNFDNCIYSFPVNYQKSEVHKVLKIDTANNTTCEVGKDVLPLANGVTQAPWHETCANAEGYIFGIPTCANSVLRFDPRNHEFKTFGQLEDTGIHKYWTGLAGPSGRYIFCPPVLASRVLCIDTQELTIELIGPDFGRGDDGHVFNMGKYLGGALGADNCIYATVFSSRRLLRIDTMSMAVSAFGPDLRRISGQNTIFVPWINLCSGMDGCLYGAHDSMKLLRIDPFAGTVSAVGEAFPTALGKLGWPILDRDGAIWFCPSFTPARMARLPPRRPDTASLSALLEPQNHVVLREGLLDLRCYGPAIAVALWREAVRTGGNCVLVYRLLEIAAAALPTVVTTSITEDNGCTADLLLRTILAVLPPEEERDTLRLNEDEVRKRNAIGAVTVNIAVPRAVEKEYGVPVAAIRVLATDRHVLSQCFSAPKLCSMLLCMLYQALNLKQSSLAAQPLASEAVVGPSSRDNGLVSMQQAIAKHVKTEWPDIAATLSAIRRAPPALSANDQLRRAFLSYIGAASAILEAPAPNAWQPLPESADKWSWPPAPLVPLRAAAKLIQNLGLETLQVMWPVLAGIMLKTLVRMFEAVRDNAARATDVLTAVFDRERKASLETYQKQLRRARRDPTFPEFKVTAAELMEQLVTLRRKEHRVQTTTSFPELYANGFALQARFHDFLAHLAKKCAGAKALHAPLKGIARALEKLVLTPGAAAKVKSEGVEAVDATSLVDVLRGSVECPDFTEIVFILDLLQLLDVDMGDAKKAKQSGWNLQRFQIRIIHIKNRFTTPTSGGWADTMVNFTFAHGDESRHVMELQLQHAQMLVVRKEGKAHAQYNKFRSAFELLEAVGREPQDCFEDTHEDLSPLEQMQYYMQHMQKQIDELKKDHQQQINDLKMDYQQKIDDHQQQIDDLKAENKALSAI